MRFGILPIAALALVACSEVPAPAPQPPVTTNTFAVEVELINEFQAALDAMNEANLASFLADRRFYGTAAKLNARGLRYELEGYSYNGGQKFKRIYRVASEEVVVFYP